MVTHLKVLSEDEKIQQQCAARADYESRLVSQFNQGVRQGVQQGIQQGIQQGQTAIIQKFLASGMSAEELAKICDMSIEEM